jgi:hypothetical protein
MISPCGRGADLRCYITEELIWSSGVREIAFSISRVVIEHREDSVFYLDVGQIIDPHPDTSAFRPARDDTLELAAST